MESEVEKASSPHSSDVPLSWTEYFPGEEFRLEDRRALLIRSLLDFFQTSAARQILSQVRGIVHNLSIFLMRSQLFEY